VPGPVWEVVGPGTQPSSQGGLPWGWNTPFTALQGMWPRGEGMAWVGEGIVVPSQ
jgi:hypothetical protein